MSNRAVPRHSLTYLFGNVRIPRQTTLLLVMDLLKRSQLVAVSWAYDKA